MAATSSTKSCSLQWHGMYWSLLCSYQLCCPMLVDKFCKSSVWRSVVHLPITSWSEVLVAIYQLECPTSLNSSTSSGAAGRWHLSGEDEDLSVGRHMRCQEFRCTWVCAWSYAWTVLVSSGRVRQAVSLRRWWFARYWIMERLNSGTCIDIASKQESRLVSE